MPSDLADLEALPGVGPYTARAVAAIAYGVPVGAVDTNVRRVLGRIVAGDPAAARPPGRSRRSRTPSFPPDAAGRLDPRPHGPGRDASADRAAPDCDACPARPWCRSAPPMPAPCDRGRRRAPALPRAGRRAVPLDQPLAARPDDGPPSRCAPMAPGSSLDAPIGDHDRGRGRSGARRARADGLIELRRRLGAAADGLIAVRLRFAARCPPPSSRSRPCRPTTPSIFELDLRGLRARWASQAALPPITAEAMTGTDRRAQALGVPEERLMEHAGTAVAAAVKALATDLGRWGTGPIVILCGPGNNGGDGLVAARRLALAGAQVIVGLVDRRCATDRRHRRPATGTASRATRGSARSICRSPATSPMFGPGIDKAAVIVDALLGTGVSGPSASRSAPRSSSIVRARASGIPVVAVDTPTAVDLSSGEPSEPAVRADLTVTFHRPKTGLADAARRRPCRQGPRGADRHPARG